MAWEASRYLATVAAALVAALAARDVVCCGACAPSVDSGPIRAEASHPIQAAHREAEDAAVHGRGGVAQFEDPP